MIIVFILMKIFGAIDFGWYGIIFAISLNKIPFATTVSYLAFKLSNVFDDTVSWWWLSFCILMDIIATINLYIKNKK